MKKTTEFNSRLVSRYFKKFLPSVTGKSIFAELDNLDTVLSFYFTDSEETWTVCFDNGRIVNVHNELSSGNEVLFELDTETFFQIVSGQLSPQESFFMSRSKIQGDTLKGLKLSSIFERFIKQYPFSIRNSEPQE